MNPSPSNDPWFDDERNMAELNRIIDEIRSGKSKLIELSDEEIKELFTCD